MAPFSDAPLDVIEEILTALQGHIHTLKACSLTCSSLFHLCRKYIFRSITLHAHPFSNITSFKRLLDSNPRISEYVQKLAYRMSSTDLGGDDAIRVLGRLHRVQSFNVYGSTVNWHTLRSPFRDALLLLIRQPSIRHWDISGLNNFPITTNLPCVNLANLRRIKLETAPVANDMLEAVLPLQSLAFTLDDSGSASSYGSKYEMGLLGSIRRPEDVFVLDLSKIRTLNVNLAKNADLIVTQALMEAADKLESFQCTDNSRTYQFSGLAVSINKSSWSTLKILRFGLMIVHDTQDPFGGLCEELGALAGLNVIEKISLKVIVVGPECKTGSVWGRLDTVLANGFPMLRVVQLKIRIWVSRSSGGHDLNRRLEKLPIEHFPGLRKNPVVMFDFSTRVEKV